jgi:hypothetical protein
MQTFILIKQSSKKFNPKLCNDKNAKYFPSIQIYTKKIHQRGKNHDKTTSNELGEVDLHYYCNVQSSTRLLYTYTPYISN